jgi:integrase
MASVADRWHTTDRTTGRKVRSSRYGSGKRWQVRYRDPAGESRNRSFDRKVDAERFLTELQHRLLRGSYVDDRAGLLPFAEYAAQWLDRQVLEPTSRVALELRLRVHINPEWGTWALRSITAAAVQRWVRRLQDEVSGGYARLIVTNFGAVLRSAVEEGLLSQNPCASPLVKMPSAPPKRLRPWQIDQVLAVVDAVPARYRALIIAAAGCGLRQGEAFGLRVQDVDFLRRELHVRQQIRIVNSAPLPALPKYRRTRTIPMPAWVVDSLAEHLATLEPLAGERTHAPSIAGLMFYGRERKPLNRNYFNTYVWRPALRMLEIPGDRENGMHALRHACASTWLEHGVSIKAVSEYLGHADPGFTLRVYTHVMPASGERAREALDAAVGKGRRPADAASSAGAPSAHEKAPRGGN